MARKTQRTGSRLLGAELRRLRGRMTLDDVVELSRSEPLCHYIESVAPATLSQMESGTSLPKMPTLHSVAVIYKVSLTHLMCLAAEDRLSSRGMLSNVLGPDCARAAFDAHVAASEWCRALPIALQQERTAADEPTRIRWRCGRALCLSQMGLHQESIDLMLDAAEERVPDARLRFHVMRTLMDAHRGAGFYNAATSAGERACDIAAECDLPCHEVALLEWSLASITTQAALCGLGGTERVLRDAVRHLDLAASKWRADDEARDAQLGLTRGEVYLALGNLLFARTEIRKASEAASRVGASWIEAQACCSLANVRQRQGAPIEARELLERAARLAEEGRHYLLSFEVSLELFKQMRERQPTLAVKHLRRCRTLHPILTSRSPMVHEFEQLTRDLA